MPLDVTDVTENPENEHYADIKHDGDILVSVDAHKGSPPTVTVFEPGEPEDAVLTIGFDENGDLDEWRD